MFRTIASPPRRCTTRAAAVVIAVTLALALAAAASPARAAAPDLKCYEVYPTFYISGNFMLGEMRIQNVGDATSDTCTVRLQIDNTTRCYVSLPRLTSLGTYSVYCSYLGPFNPGSHQYNVLVDCFSHVSESNEANNTYIQYFYIDWTELSIDHLSPDTLHIGRKAQITAWVKNSGGVASPPTTTYIGYGISGGPVCSPVATPAIAPGATVAVHCDSIPVSLATPNEFHACVDWSNVVVEEQERNCLGKGMVVVGPDLVIQRIAPDTALPGLGLTAQVTVVNQGLDPAGASQTRLQVVGGGTYVVATPALASGQATTHSIFLGAFTEGIVELQAAADVGDQVSELFETNNTLNKKVTVGAPDLIVSRISLSSTTAGVPVTATVTVRNQGLINAPATVTGLSRGTGQAWGIATPALMSGDSVLVSVAIGSLPATLYSFKACADSTHVVSEMFEDNNCLSRTVRFWPPAAVVVRANGTGDYPTIQAAIDAVSDYALIELADGTFLGQGNRDLSFKGKRITVRSQSGNPNSCIIDCGGSSAAPHRGFAFATNEDTTSILEGVQVRNGWATEGAGIRCSYASPRLVNVSVQHCTASGSGGGIWLDHSSPVLEDLLVNYCVSQAGTGGGGGGLFAQSYSSPRLTNCSFGKNTASDRGGGALFSVNCFPIVSGCLFEINTAVNGGGLCFVYAFGPVTECQFLSNVADYGGGLQCYGNAQAPVTRCTFYANEARNGSGIYFRLNSSPTIRNTIVSYGRGGLALDRYATDCNPTLECTDLWDNEGGDWEGFVADQRHLRNNFGANPGFCQASSDVFTLRGDSPCAPRNNPACGQVGAKPVGCSFVVTVRPDGTGDYPTIQAAIDARANGDVIELADGTFTGSGNRDLDTKGKRLTLRSESGDRTRSVIDCQGSAGTPRRGFNFHTHEDSLTVLGDFTIRNGYATQGGGIALTAAGPRIQHVVLEACHATSGGGGLSANDTSKVLLHEVTARNCASDDDGGGMFFGNWSSARLDQCTLQANSAADRGGGALFSVNCFPILTDCTFDQNRAGTGGGLMFVYAFGPVSGSVFWRNTATVEGGGVACYGNAQAVLERCTIFGNTSPNGAGIHFRNNSSPTIRTSVVSGCGPGAALARLETNCNPVLECTNLWGNEAGDWVGFIEAQQAVAGNMSVDPMFCGPLAGLFTVDDQSPCLPANNGCNEWLGALGPGCTVLDAGDGKDAPPAAFFARPNAPNPFNALTAIAFGLPAPAPVTLRVYNVAGRLVRTLAADHPYEAGVFQVVWDGRDDDGRSLGSGIYFYRLHAGANRVLGRMVLVR